MQTLQNWLQKFLLPIAMKIEKQKHLQAVKDGVVAIIPIIIIGSFCLIPIGIGNLIGGGVSEFVTNNAAIFNFPTYFTTSIMSVYSAFFIADSLAKRYRLKSSLIGVSAILVHLILCVNITETGWDVSSLGAEGLFVSIIAAITVVEITRLMDKYHLVIKMPESVPPMVAESFSILIPLTVNVILASTVSLVCMNMGGTTFPKVIMGLLAPAISSMDSLPAVIIVVLLTQLLWVFGLHGAAITSSVWAPFAIAYGAENAANVAAGLEPTHIFTFGFYYGFLQVTGSGLTLGLVILMCMSKSKSLKSIGKIGLVPSIFGINEPIIFGVPMIMNPFMFIPFVFGPVLVAIITYLAMDFGFIALPLWEAPGFLPPGFQAFLLTMDWKAAALAIFSVVLMTVLYYPFFKMFEADEVRKEKELENKAKID